MTGKNRQENIKNTVARGSFCIYTIVWIVL